MFASCRREDRQRLAVICRRLTAHEDSSLVLPALFAAVFSRRAASSGSTIQRKLSWRMSVRLSSDDVRQFVNTNP